MKGSRILQIYPFFTTEYSRFHNDLVRMTFDGVNQLRSEQPGGAIFDVLQDYRAWRSMSYSDVALHRKCMQAWEESLVFALHNSITFVSVQEKEQILEVVKDYSPSTEMWMDFLLGFARSCRLDSIDWLEKYFQKSELEQNEQFRIEFYAKISWNKAFAKNHPYIPKKFCSSRQ